MERLTSKYWRNLDPWEMCGQDNYCKRGCHDQGGCTNGCIVPRIYARLAAYEDTGLEPEDMAHWMDYFRAECEDRLVVLPCKVGDTIYYTREGYPIVEPLKVRTFFVGDPTRRGEILHLHMIRTDKFDVSMDALGKTVFLTREEAEAAMAQKGDSEQ